MHFHIIIDHPWKDSFNFAILNSVVWVIKENQQSYDVLDLNREKFNPVMSTEELAVYKKGISFDPLVKKYQERLAKADYLFFIFPIWWNVMPAMLKGWMDKVLLPGFAFTNGQVPKPLLSNIRGATVITSTANPDKYHREEFNNTIKNVLCNGALKFIGVQDTTWLNFGETGVVSKKEHENWIGFIKNYTTNLVEKNQD